MTNTKLLEELNIVYTKLDELKAQLTDKQKKAGVEMELMKAMRKISDAGLAVT